MASIDQVGRRIYLRDTPYAAKDAIRATGAKWDREQRAWWIGVAKRAVAEQLLASLASAPTADGEPAERRERPAPGLDATIRRPSTLDRICPDESHLPPSRRAWARMIRLQGGFAALELRDPNDGQSADPADKTRHQYMVRDGRVWTRRLPPATLEDERDDAPWTGEDEYERDASRWRLLEPRSDLPWQWAVEEHGVRPYSTIPISVDGQWDLHGDGDYATIGYYMPPGDPWDSWAAITSRPGAPVRCPLCDQDLVWYEAGYVPGYRVCMARSGEGRYDADSIRHRFLLRDGVLVLDE